MSSARFYRSTTPRALYYSSACHLPLRSRVFSRVPQHHAPYITQVPATSVSARVSSARFYRSTTPRALYYSSACHLPLRSRELRAPLSFHNAARPILFMRLSPPFTLACLLSRSTTPRALYYSSACHLPLRSRELRAPLSFHNAARPILFMRLSPPFTLACLLSRSTTPRALYYSSACHLPLRSRELRAPLSFHNAARPILFMRLSPPFTLACLLSRSTTPRALYYSSACHLPLRSRVSSRVPQHHAPYITQVPATSLFARVSSARQFCSATLRAHISHAPATQSSYLIATAHLQSWL